MLVVSTDHPDLRILEPKLFADERGWFTETYRAEVLAMLGVHDVFVQDNHSHSRRGVLRGLHFQVGQPQTKLCRVVRGEVLDVAVDIRRGSPRFGQWAAVVLSAENRRMLLVPAGFAHGFRVLSESADFLYKCTAYYDPADERGIRWDDPTLAIDWWCGEAEEEPALSPRDRALPWLVDLSPEDLPVWEGAG